MATDPVEGAGEGAAARSATAALRILGYRRLAAGNVLGRRPAVTVAIETAAGLACDDDAIAALLAGLGPDLEDEFRLARVEAADAPLPRAFAALIVALVAERRDLAARVTRMPGAGRSRWYVLVEDGISIAADTVVQLALDLFLCAVSGRAVDAALRQSLEKRCGTAAERLARGERAMLAGAIEARRHGWSRDAHGVVSAIGEGRWRVRLRNAVTMRTMAPGAILAERKDRTRLRLARIGLPVPRQARVADAAAARAAAIAIGYPVVVKPMDASNARGVSIDLSTPAAVTAAFALARTQSRHVIVESQLPGETFRLLVIDGRLIAAVHSSPGRVVGDGRRTMAELVEEANRVPKRQRPRPLQRAIAWTAEILEYLAGRGLTPESIPAAGSLVLLHWNGHGARGGSALAVTDPIHPDNRLAACQAAEAVGVDVAGIDMILPDIARSWRETGGGICEVNRAPGLRYHLVADGLDTPVPGRYLDYLLDRPGLAGAGGPRTIPILVFLGGAEMEGPALAAAALLQRRGLAVGLAAAGRYEAAGLPLAHPGPGSPLRMARLADDPSVGAIVAVVPPTALMVHGLGHSRVDLGVVAGGAEAGEPAALLARLGAEIVPVAALADGHAVRRVVDRHRTAVPPPEDRFAGLHSRES